MFRNGSPRGTWVVRDALIPVTPSEARGLIVLGQCWLISNEILRLTPQNDSI